MIEFTYLPHSFFNKPAKFKLNLTDKEAKQIFSSYTILLPTFKIEILEILLLKVLYYYEIKNDFCVPLLMNLLMILNNFIKLFQILLVTWDEVIPQIGRFMGNFDQNQPNKLLLSFV